jgi:hypothetical protein
MNYFDISSETFRFFKDSPKPTIKHTSYFQVYDELFSKFRNRKITFIEIGVLNGGSLFMWRNYFGEHARIIGIDLNPEAKKWELDGFEIYIGNQGDIKFWQTILPLIGRIDILLDDGGHTYKQQVVTVESVMQNMEDDGLLIIEDVQTSYLRGFGPRKYSFINYTKKMIDRINFRNSELDKTIRNKCIIWSVQTFESIVVFHINRKKASIKSTRISNKQHASGTIDYRYLDNSIFKSIKIFQISTLKNFKIMKIIGMQLLRLVSYLDAIKSRYFKYFK